MPGLSVEQLSAHIEQLKASTESDRDELLRDLLVHVYPTKLIQDT